MMSAINFAWQIFQLNLFNAPLFRNLKAHKFLETLPNLGLILGLRTSSVCIQRH